MRSDLSRENIIKVGVRLMQVLDEELRSYHDITMDYSYHSDKTPFPRVTMDQLREMGRRGEAPPLPTIGWAECCVEGVDGVKTGLRK